jgi:1,4-alpha-glucan branching enzyme
MAQGYVMLVLHAHLPYVRHPEHRYFLEESWLFEAMLETYLPLLDMMERLAHDGCDFRFTMSLTPPLMSMLRDPVLQNRFREHSSKLLELCEKEVQRLSRDSTYRPLAEFYRDRFGRLRALYDRHGGDVVGALGQMQQRGFLEIITCTATHGFLPTMVDRTARRAQIQVAVESYRQHLGTSPRGIWLAECGYAEGVDELLAEAGLRFFFMDSHGVLYGTPRPRYGLWSPIYTPSGVAAFGRDVESSRQVWSQHEGYPGDFDYREFYRDVGFDREDDYIAPYVHPDGIRLATGLKYHRVTGPSGTVALGDKAPYNPGVARERAAMHAGNFMFNRQAQAAHLAAQMDREPIIVAPYDAELFGHWWFEGPDFLEFLARKMHWDQDRVKLITAPEYLEMYPTQQVVTPATSSWGAGGYARVWLDSTNDWIYRHLHRAAKRMMELARDNPYPDELRRRALNQAARELLLAQSSDWAFIMKTKTAVDYAVNRTKAHLARFMRLDDEIRENRIDGGWLWDVEQRDAVFPEIDYRVYS